jgi:LysM repeat protein
VQRIRITNAEGVAWTQQLEAVVFNIGRASDNDLVLEDPAVSSKHCLVEFDGYNYIVKDRGSANGTFINNARVTEPTVLREGDRLYVGPFLVELVSLAEAMARAAAPRLRAGPILRDADPRAEQVREAERLRRWARQWEDEGRPRHLLLRGESLARAGAILGRADPRDPADALVRVFVARGRSARVRRTVGRGVTGLGGVLAVAALGWIALDVWQARHGSDEDPQSEPEALAPPEPATVAPPATPSAPADEWIEHEVIPAETLEDIARRYEVTPANVARWNRLNPDEPEISTGVVLRIKPNRRPLPQQQITFELDKRYDWRSLAERFDVPVGKLRAYNPEVDDLRVGTQIAVWIDPKPYETRQIGTIPIFDVRPDAYSIGRPNDGRLENGIQLPASDLYTRRAPFIQWGSSHTIQHLQTAIARFRQEVSFDGEVVISDISRKSGGNFFPPHKSHQAGRDIDIWMPTLKGVYKQSYLEKERKPKPNEIDWFATWGLVRALIETDQIVHIFLTYELQERLHRAAEIMGATPEELERAIQWPRGRWASGIVGDSPGHTGHIHVRFKCGPNDTRCIHDVSRQP